jgi:hypothetical protein
MRKLHLIAGLLGVLVFVLSGQAMRLHKPAIRSLEDAQRMMYVSRHIYILGSALVNRKRLNTAVWTKCGLVWKMAEVGTYECVHLGNKWTSLRSGQSLGESHRDDDGRLERSAGLSNRL